MPTDDGSTETEQEESTVTIYLTPVGFAKASREFMAMEKTAGCVIALGTGDWINVYTTDTKAVVRVVDFLGKPNVVEIA